MSLGPPNHRPLGEGCRLACSDVHPCAPEVMRQEGRSQREVGRSSAGGTTDTNWILKKECLKKGM